MKFLIRAIVLKSVFVAVCLFSGSAFAQDITALMPTSGWLVGPASLNQDSNGEKLPCLAVNQFANGLTLRLSGGGNKLIAMAVDFHQKFFKPHQKYDAEFSMPGNFSKVLNGSAYDDQTLVFSLYKIQDFYKSLQTADTLTIKGGETTITLNLSGLADGLQRMETCYTTKPVVKTAQKSSAKKTSRQNPLIAEASGLTPMPGETELPPPHQPVEDEDGAPVQRRRIAVTPEPEEPVDSAKALLARAKDADQAAQELSKRSSAKEKPAGQQMAPAWTQPQARRTQADVLSQSTTLPVKATAEEPHWQAVKGSDLREVLTTWSQSAGVKLIWLAKQNFIIDRTISMSGDFAFAAQSLLDQYAALKPRPVGHIYHEKGSNSLVLVVE